MVYAKRSKGWIQSLREIWVNLRHQIWRDSCVSFSVVSSLTTGGFGNMKLSWFDWMFSFDQSRGALWWCLHGRHLHGIAAYGRWVCAPNLWLENPEFRIVRSLGRLNKLCTVGDGCVSQSMIYNLPWKGLSGMADYSYRLTSTNRWQKRQSSHLHEETFTVFFGLIETKSQVR